MTSRSDLLNIFIRQMYRFWFIRETQLSKTLPA
jgi:hypothetical protein